MRSMQHRQPPPESSWKDCCGCAAGRRAADLGRRTSDVGLPAVGHQTLGLTSEIRWPRSDVRGPTSDARLEQALRVTDLLLQSGGFGLVAIDLGDVPDSAARRIPLASWFRFQRAVEPTATVLLVVAQAALCSDLRFCADRVRKAVSSQLSALSEKRLGPAHAQLLDGLHIEGELLRSRMQRKPAQSVTAAFATKASSADCCSMFPIARARRPRDSRRDAGAT